MKSKLIAMAALCIFATGCGDTAHQETTSTDSTQTSAASEVSNTQQAELDSTTHEIETASDEVDSLVNQL